MTALSGRICAALLSVAAVLAIATGCEPAQGYSQNRCPSAPRLDSVNHPPRTKVTSRVIGTVTDVNKTSCGTGWNYYLRITPAKGGPAAWWKTSRRVFEGCKAGSKVYLAKARSHGDPRCHR